MTLSIITLGVATARGEATIMYSYRS